MRYDEEKFCHAFNQVFEESSWAGENIKQWYTLLDKQKQALDVLRKADE